MLDVGQLETLRTRQESRDLVRLRLSKALLGVAEAQALVALVRAAAKFEGGLLVERATARREDAA